MASTRRRFQVWKTLTLGQLSPRDGNFVNYTARLRFAGCHFSDWTWHNLDWVHNHAILWEQPTAVELVKVNGGQLGQNEKELLAKIYERAASHGLYRCLPEVAPALRVEYTDQPMGECLWVAMKSIRLICSMEGFLRTPHSLFVLERNDKGLSISAARGAPDNVCHPEDVWVFATKPASEYT